MKRRPSKPPEPPRAAAPAATAPPPAAPAAAPPPSPLSPADFRALRDLVSGRVHIVEADVRDRLVRDGWATCEADAYFFSDAAREFVRTLPPDRAPHWYADAATLILLVLAAWLLVACDLVGAEFTTSGAPRDASDEVLVDVAAPDVAGDVDAAASDGEPLDAPPSADAAGEVLVDALVPDGAGAGDASVDAVDDVPVDVVDEALVDGPPDLDAPDDGGGLDAGGPSCDAGTVLHNNGVGETFCDPAPLGSYPSSLVRGACDAFARATPSAVCTEASSERCPSAVTATVSTATLALCLTWTNAGHVHDAGSNVCACPSSTDPAWQ